MVLLAAFCSRLYVLLIDRVVPRGSYRVGNKITWHTFCSASLSMEVTKSFMSDKTTGVCSGTLFIIKDTVCGCDVQPFSFMPEKGLFILFSSICCFCLWFSC